MSKVRKREKHVTSNIIQNRVYIDRTVENPFDIFMLHISGGETSDIVPWLRLIFGVLAAPFCFGRGLPSCLHLFQNRREKE